MKTMTWRLLAHLLTTVAVAAHAAPYAFITESQGVSVIDVERRVVANRIPLADAPVAIAVNPGGARAYTSSFTGPIQVIDTAARAVIATIPVRSDSLALNPAGTRLYTVDAGTDFPTAPPDSDVIRVVDPENRVVIRTISGVSRGPLVMNPLGTRLFMSSLGANRITVIDTQSDSVVATIAVPDGPRGMVVDPAGRRLYVAQYGRTTPGDTVTVIDLATNTIVGSVRVGMRPDRLAIHPSGTRLYVSNFGSNTVSHVDTASLGVIATVPVGSGPSGIDVTPSGEFVYVANSLEASVSVLRALHPSVFETIPVGNNPTALGRFFGGPATFAPQTPNILSGLWWNAAESGWGIHLTQRGNTLFAAWFTYDQLGNPHWYVSSNCAMSPPLACPDCVDGAFCSGDIYETSGPRFFRDPFDPRAVQVFKVGVLQLGFRNKDEGSMAYVLGSNTRKVTITRQVFRPPVPEAAINYTDLWWNPGESGWGLGITHQAGVMFLTWFVYQDTGLPTWLVASECVVNSAATGCSGTLYRTSGPQGPIVTNTFDASRVRVNAVGTIDVAFTDANNGVITYTVDGIPGSKTIMRQIF